MLGAARRPASTASSLQLHALPHRHPLRHRSSSARGRHGLGRAVTFRSASAFQSTRSGLQQVRVLRKLMPGKGSYMDVLCYSQDLEEVRRRSCHCILLPWLQLCLDRLTPISHVVWCCSLFMHSLQVLAFCLTALRHAGAFQKSKIQEWPVDEVSDSGLFAGL